MNNRTSTTQLNTFIGGMNSDTDDTLLSSNQYRDAQDIRVLSSVSGDEGIVTTFHDYIQIDTATFADKTVMACKQILEYFVVLSVDSNENNYLHLITDNPYTCKLVCWGKWGVLSPADMVLNVVYVDDNNVSQSDVIYAYFANQDIYIGAINVLGTYDTTVEYTSDKVFTESYVHLDQPVVQKLDSDGSLNSGRYQFTYQLYSKYGRESNWAPLTGILNMNTGTQGGNAGTATVPVSTNRSVTLGFNWVSSDAYDRIRIVSVYYPSHYSVPTVGIVYQGTISTSVNSLTYKISTSTLISTITLDEFNSIYNLRFKAATIAVKDNYMFAGNIKEDASTFDSFDYDATTYRFNIGGLCLLSDSANQTITGATVVDGYSQFAASSLLNGSITIPQKHDRLCAINEHYYDGTAYDVYCRDSNGNIGGTGLNVNYRFITAPYVADVAQGDNFSYTISGVNKSQVDISYLGQSGIIDSIDTSSSADDDATTYDYGNPLFANKLTGYSRDEIYRFGIVFYDKYGRVSPVKWVGDIRFPNDSQAPIASNDVADTLWPGDTHLTMNILGIQFTVKVPDNENVVGFEIVRAKRTNSDKRVLGAFVISNTIWGVDTNANAPFYAYDANDYPNIGVVDRAVTAYPLPFLADNMKMLFLGQYNAGNRISTEVDGQVATGKQIIFNPECCIYTSGDLEDVYKHASFLKPLYSISPYSSTVENRKRALRNGEELSNPTKSGSLVYQTFTGHEFGGNNYTFFSNLTGAMPCGAGADGGVARNLYYKYYNITSITGDVYKVNQISYASTYENDKVQDTLCERNVQGVAIGNTQSQVFYANVTESLAATETGVSYQSRGWKMRSSDDPDMYSYGGGIQGSHGACCSIVYDGTATGPVNTITDWNTQYASAINTNIVKLYSEQPIYGGFTYSAINTTEYISTGCYKALNGEDTVTVNVFGGDTYVYAFDYQNTSMYTDTRFPATKEPGFDDSMYSQALNGGGSSVIYFPIESSVNAKLTHDNRPALSDLKRINNIYKNSVDKTPQYLVSRQFYPASLSGWLADYVTTDVMYGYNDAYSAESQRTMVSEDEDTIDAQRTINRVYASEQKQLLETLDSWLTFKYDNYIDVDSTKGEITNLYSFNDKLYCFQNNGISILSVNERSLITDDDSSKLVLGTGTILQRYDYISNLYGTHTKNNRTLCNSDGILYFTDAVTKNIYQISGQVDVLSKSKHVQKLSQDALQTCTFAFYDTQTNEVVLTNNSSFSLAYNERMQAFTSRYTITPTAYSNYNMQLVISNGSVYRYNTGAIQAYTDTTLYPYITFNINESSYLTKVFDNIRFYDDNTLTTVKELNFSTLDQEAGTTAIKLLESDYAANITRDYNTGSRMRGKYLITTIQFDNTSTTKSKIPYFKTNFRYSLI